ncbi:MAG: sigma-54 dependent transcriptional regulator [Candidatus Cloacimonadaceae bacterium]|jgi:DNA-binding NtrC family response regulator|nr:sigma-54 dependent transcriptional regulator [Candidatus Cloacimonadota bacterium]MCB5254424.1 sigma-54 dependent transcriptional regulator [Candidatus Cloacimonadota bacterium]MCK9178098.1 sigma-54 dependent transcriptional regulator [Candidatus Cloacimonadota bacterium]MCK9241847.1 sigma-54 dependent transcriptional regulator [Candidatus Cloacimonadota bacterium]MDY0127177.1 sigma-54 dependent transcriptional regulator [Candidatus Cloacimonadaceae bacterium]
MAEIKILIADDDYMFCRLTADLIRSQGYLVETASSCEEVRALLDEQHFDLMMQDMRFPALQDGFGMLEEAHARFPDMAILMISGSGHIPDAVNAIKYGASDFIEKPIAKEHLLIRLSRLSESIAMHKELRNLQVSSIGMFGSSPPMQKVYDVIIRAAKFDAPVLISGETGVGKELAARAIHRLSDHSAREMVRVNCASIPHELFEAEIFGYEKGAFTGATESRKGFFEYAENSSLFLDEISTLPLPGQAKLLRAISEREIQKLGGKAKTINTRIISASNQDLTQKIKDGSFRDDLYYRISNIHIEIPPLRERTQDIIPLCLHFINSFCIRHQIMPKSLTPSATAWLLEQSYPGNIRELKNLAEHAVVFSSSDTLNVVDFTTTRNSEEEQNLSYREIVLNFERNFLEQAFIENGLNISRTASYLKMDKSNLSKKLSALGIEIHRK